MVWILGILLLMVPSLELWLLVRMGYSWTVTAVWCAATAAVGWRFARQENLSLWTELESGVQNGHLPTTEGVDMMLVLLGGWGLIVPGLVPDLAGGALLVPPLRRVITDIVRNTIRDKYL